MRLRACVLGATGIVGQHFVRLLQDHPSFELVAVTASEQSHGKRYTDATDWIVSEQVSKSSKDLSVQLTTVQDILQQSPDIIFSALPSEIAYQIESDLAQEGLPVFSNAGAHRMDPVVPILIPEVNPDHLMLIEHQDYGDGFIITNSNCSTSGLVMVLRPLVDFGIQRVTVTTFQAVSGAGRRGIAALDILNNVIPFIPREEEKMVMETKEILGTLSDGRIIPASLDVNASCARVPVRDGHLESVVIDFTYPTDRNTIIDELESFIGEPQRLRLPIAPKHPIIVMQQEDRPQPKRDLSSNGMEVHVGRLRVQGSRLNIFLLVYNTIRGAAGASVLNAEFAKAKGVID